MSQDPFLPPGVSSSMIPGNRPGDDDDETFFDALDVRLKKELTDEGYRRFVAAYDLGYDDLEPGLLAARDLGYERGLAEARNEAELERQLDQQPDEDERG